MLEEQNWSWSTEYWKSGRKIKQPLDLGVLLELDQYWNGEYMTIRTMIEDLNFALDLLTLKYLWNSQGPIHVNENYLWIVEFSVLIFLFPFSLLFYLLKAFILWVCIIHIIRKTLQPFPL